MTWLLGHEKHIGDGSNLNTLRVSLLFQSTTFAATSTMVPMAIEDLSTTTIFLMIFGLVLISFGGGALAAYVYDEDRKKTK